MKIKYILVALLIVALAALGTGCKITGGGHFTNEPFGQPLGEVNFGFNAHASEDGVVKGQFQLVDHSTKPPTRVHGTFEGMATAGIWDGTCTVNGEGPYPLQVVAQDAGEPGPDAGDFINVFIDGALMYSGYLEGGNIQAHPAKPE
jgi:hypothetical protein